jgi:hypothetical protein
MCRLLATVETWYKEKFTGYADFSKEQPGCWTNEGDREWHT